MAVIAGVDYGPDVVEFPWAKKWALMCMDVGSKEGPQRVNEICEVLNEYEKAEVREMILNFRQHLVPSKG